MHPKFAVGEIQVFFVVVVVVVVVFIVDYI